ncbi:hypothetical protein ASD03_26550 [Ensifer sp. Root127]|nr:hypothetical protein ASD03_26550 [Ensifer sp. Root127]
MIVQSFKAKIFVEKSVGNGSVQFLFPPGTAHISLDVDGLVGAAVVLPVADSVAFKSFTSN